MEFKSGMVCKIVQDTCCHKRPIGTTVTLHDNCFNSSGRPSWWINKECSVYVIESDMVPVDQQPAKTDLERLMEDWEKAKSATYEIELKIDFLKKNKIEKFDPMEYKVWRALRVFKSTKSEIEKARIIAELIKK